MSIQEKRKGIDYYEAFSVHLHNAMMGRLRTLVAWLVRVAMICTYDLIGPACAAPSVSVQLLHNYSMGLLYRDKLSM